MVSSDNIVIPNDSVGPVNISHVGAKAKGISNLPPNWVPSFFVISCELSRRWNNQNPQNTANCVKRSKILSEDEIELITNALKSIGITDKGKVIVRSSSPEEGIELRGMLESKVSEATTEAILASCDFIYERASSKYVKKLLGSPNLAIIVQTYIEPKEAGHLSNERRVAKRRQEWLWEFEHRQKHPTIGRFALKYGKSRTIPASTGELIANKEETVISQLRSVAAYVNKEELRLHMEWIWDGQRIWIVQGDKDAEKKGANPRSYTSVIKSSQSTTALNSFIPVSSITHGRWEKLLCVKEFKNAGLPTAELWALEDVSIISNLSTGLVTKGLKQDIKALLSSPIVIRMDIIQNSIISGDMLPRSDCITTEQQAEEFFIEKSRNLLLKGINPEDFCFVVHHYIPSRSSAFCLAYPNHPRVRIDSIWGLPDGLIYYPHDSFELNPDNLSTMQKLIRFKDDYLAPAYDGDWKPVKAGKPWDWSSSITDEELILIGKSSQRLANYVNDCVQIMWFVDIPPNLGLPSLLPWFRKKGEPPKGAYEADPRVFSRNRVFIYTKDDLEEIESASGKTSEETVLRISPRTELLRDSQFLKTLADIAKKHNMPVELQGSVLQHAYYQLKQEGVKIQCVHFFKPVFKSQKFGKLVRDQIPLRIQRRGERAYTITITGDALNKVLKAKVVEEALELLSATNAADIEEELSDVLDVIFSLAERMGFTREELEKKIEIKRKESGGFREGLILAETKEVPLIDIDINTSQFKEKGEKSRLPLSDLEEGIAKITTRRIPQFEGDNKILIPLVPPDIRESVLEIGDIGIKLKIRYEDKDIILSWGRGAPRIPREQLPLPGLDI